MTLPSSGPLSMNDIAGEFGGSTPHALNEYYAGGGLVPAGTSGTYGAVPSSGTISIQNFYGTSNYVPVYIEELFQTWLYTGNDATQTITNGINLAANGGLVWCKTRTTTFGHLLFDTNRGIDRRLRADSTDAEVYVPNSLTSYNTNGFSVGPATFAINTSPQDYVSWTFRKQPKFFDIVTYTGNGASLRTINHNLGSVPGCIIVKSTSTSWSWFVYHRGLGTTSGYPDWLRLDQTNAAVAGSANVWAAAPTSTSFSIGDASVINENGQTYVAYLFAHNAGGFGATGTDNVITCGSFTGITTGNVLIDLGYEPQWLLTREANAVSNWRIVDNMRGFTNSSSPSSNTNPFLFPNTSDAETDLTGREYPVSNGFRTGTSNRGGNTWIYIAIRRGPMKTPTTGTSVFSATNSNSGGFITTNFTLDSLWQGWNNGSSVNASIADRLRGVSTTTNIRYGPYLATSSTGAEASLFSSTQNWTNIGFTNADAGNNTCQWAFRRAPGFFDVVCYSGDGAASQTIPHNLGVTPELIINRRRANNSGVANPQWLVWRNSTSAGILNNDESFDSSSYPAFITSVGATSYSVNNSVGISSLQANLGADSYVTYLFATCPGVSKVGVYTGTGALQTINCGFTGGARFVLIKRIDSGSGFTGLPWYVWDSARGISSSSDPYLRLNSSAAQVTGTNYVDTTSVGFQVTAAAPTSINGSGGSFLFLAIA